MELRLKVSFLLLNFFLSFALSETDVEIKCRKPRKNQIKCVTKDFEVEEKNSIISDVTLELPDEITYDDVTIFIAQEQQCKYFPKKLSEKLKNLVQFEVTDSGLKEIGREVFNGLSAIEKLTLSKNKLESLPEDVFDDLVNLKALKLDKNQITELHYRVFNKNLNLETLHLENNTIAKLHENIFKGLSNLREIHIQNNLITDLKEMTFADNNKLEILNFGDNRLEYIGPDLLTNLTNLNNFNFFGNKCLKDEDMKLKGLGDMKEVFTSLCLPPYVDHFYGEIKKFKENISLVITEMNKHRDNASLYSQQLGNCQEEKKSKDRKCESDYLELKKKHESELSFCAAEKSEVKAAYESFKNNIIKPSRVDDSCKDCEAECNEKLKNFQLDSQTNISGDNVRDSCVADSSEIDDLTMQLQQSNEKIAKLEEDLKDAQSKVSDLEKQIQSAKSHGDDGTTKTALKAQINAKQSELEVCKTNLLNREVTLNDTIFNKNEIIEKSKESETQCTDQIKNLQSELAKKSSEVTKLSMCSSFYIHCTYSSISPKENLKTKDEEYICNTKHVQACHSDMKLSGIDGTHLKGKTNYDVTTLDISDSIFQLNNQIFGEFPNMKVLKLQNVGLSSLRPKLENTRLEELVIDGNKIVEVEGKIFDGLKNLKSLDLLMNEIKKLNADSFDGLKYLGSLNLDQNQISELPKGVFDGLTELTHFSIANNKVKELDGNLFAKNAKLQVINFKQNRDLMKIEPKLLDHATQLRLVNFSESCITSFGKDNIKEELKRKNGCGNDK